MPKYISLVNWTDQGIKSVKDAPKRMDAARALAKKMGCEMTKVYMTMGAHDLVVVFMAPDDETMAKLTLSIAAGGNVRTTTLKAFSEPSFRAIIGGLT